jgi:phosphoglucosamine mutase
MPMSKRKYFGTDGIRGRTGQDPITAEFALKLGWSVGQILVQDGHGTVLIGKDTRVSGYMLSAGLEAGLISSGLDVWLLGPIPTPGVAYLTHSLGAQVGIVVSASHNPYYDNGIKFFGAEGKKFPDSIEEKIESLLEQPLLTTDPKNIGRAKILEDGKGRYIEFCKSTFPRGLDLKGMKIVIDCANGATYHIAPHVFAELGADVIPMHYQPDGFNINDKCGTTHPESLQKAVVKHQAELGIAFDGDGDRVIFVDHQGNIVDGDELLYVIAMGYKQQNKEFGGVVGTLMSNLGLEQALKSEGIDFVRANVGDRYVLAQMEANNWLLGGEASGHILCADKTTTGDGIVAALQVLAEIITSNRSLKDLCKNITKTEQILINVPVPNGRHVVEDASLLNALKQNERDLGSKGRIVLRPSGTEPLVRVMVEGQDKSLIQTVAQDMTDVVQEVSRRLQLSTQRASG